MANDDTDPNRSSGGRSGVRSRIRVLLVTALVAVAALAPTGGRAAAFGTPCSWQRVDSPNASRQSNALLAAAPVDASDVWAVGTYNRRPPLTSRTLVERWDGSAWAVVPAPSASADLNALTSVSALSADDVWAVGSYTVAATGAFFGFSEHWDGTRWRLVPIENPAGTDTTFYGVDTVSGSDVWAVGLSLARS